MLSDRRKIGDKGEKIAKKFLKKKGYKILVENYHTRVGEIDIIAFDKKQKELVFVEVKTRTNDLFGSPEEAIHFFKLQKMLRAAHQYLLKNNLLDHPYRLDAVAIEITDQRGTEVRHYERVGGN